MIFVPDTSSTVSFLNPDQEKRDQLRHVAAIYELQCDLAIIVEDGSLEERFVVWTTRMLSDEWNESGSALPEQRRHLVRYLESKLPHVTRPDVVISGLENLRLSRDGNSTSQPTDDAAAVSRQLADMAGQKLREVSEVE